MGDSAREIGQTVREAIRSWPATWRLVVILVASAGVAICVLLIKH